ncbi:MAG: hypothetical protein Q4A75_05000, partial [Peptostreptococcaceae bacterium]|nr:hypothetical protein [Peptostreptococcaceae bacterium]
MADYNEIIGFLDGYLKNKGVITEGDDPKLEEFMRDLGAKVDQLSLIPENGGDKLILYSGRYGE